MGGGCLVWDVRKGQLLRTVDSSLDDIGDLQISRDGSKVFGGNADSIEVQCISTGEAKGLARFHDEVLMWQYVPQEAPGGTFEMRNHSHFPYPKRSQIDIAWISLTESHGESP